LGIVSQFVEAHDWTVDAMRSAEGGLRIEITDVSLAE
jgi:hypothetical protein